MTELNRLIALARMYHNLADTIDSTIYKIQSQERELVLIETHDLHIGDPLIVTQSFIDVSPRNRASFYKVGDVVFYRGSYESNDGIKSHVTMLDLSGSIGGTPLDVILEMKRQWQQTGQWTPIVIQGRETIIAREKS